MKPRYLTGLIIGLTIIMWVLWDFYAFSKGGDASTISVVITDFSYYSPAMPLFLGMLMGHFFIPPIGSGKKEL